MVPTPVRFGVETAAPVRDAVPAQPPGHGNVGKLAVPAPASTPVACADGIMVAERRDAAAIAVPIPAILLRRDVFIEPPNFVRLFLLQSGRRALASAGSVCLLGVCCRAAPCALPVLSRRFLPYPRVRRPLAWRPHNEYGAGGRFVYEVGQTKLT